MLLMLTLILTHLFCSPGKRFRSNVSDYIKYIITNNNDSSSNKRRPKEAPNYDVEYETKCQGNWRTDYSELHRNSLETSKKYLVFKCSKAGWGNRVRALLSSFHLAIISKRAFIIDCPKPSPLEKYLEPNLIKWNYKINMTGLTVRFRSPKFESFGAGGFKKTDFETNLTNAVEGIHAYNGIFYNELKENPKYNLPNSHMLLGCSFYFLFKKSKYLEKNIKQARDYLGFEDNIVLGIHIRRGDISFNHNRGDIRIEKVESTDNYFSCAEKIEKRIQEKYNTTKTIWFLASDSVEVKQYAEKKYPGKIRQLHGPVEHVGHPRRGNEDAGHLSMFLDVFLLQQSDFRLLSGGSTFPTSFTIITMGNANTGSVPFSGKTKTYICRLPLSLIT